VDKNDDIVNLGLWTEVCSTGCTECSSVTKY